MKTTWDELMQYAPEKDYAMPPLDADVQERILGKTMQKIEKKQTKKPARALRTMLIAAAVAALLCGTAFAAYTNGWFGFDRLFGSKTALIERNITSYDENAAVDITQPAYTEEEQTMIAEGTMQVPELAQVAETGVSAQTDDFGFTLETMLVSDDSLYAIVRVDAKNEEAADCLSALQAADQTEKERARMLQISAMNNTGTGREWEWKNGGMGMDIVQLEGDTAYALLYNNGGEFVPGDKILFQTWYQDATADLFEVPVPAQLETKLVLSLNAEAGTESYYCWQQATITPISFRLDGSYGTGTEEDVPVVIITLKDGTSFELACTANGFADSPYGTYGSLSFSEAGDTEADAAKSTWLFSQLIDLDELASITVDGVTYPIE